ncbi:DUF11 domain-containing protein [Paraclostridium ghonii]|uniref:DUF11 domain-containing protein n=1 Tax=Paraclostridium ghonii TaxID=29358 RepID=UPI00202CEFB7|nr:DUF11 domain-containing protein [Paeniclostridium ghonii]MCM0167957.1 hypothetical protein [Paeniclostridium ghonii]
MIDQTLIKQKIELGLDWVTSNQNQDKSFGTLYPILNTALVVLELEQYAISLGLSPLDISYKYYNSLVSGLEYLFSNSKSSAYGIYYEEDENINYTTGVVLAAICSSQAPDKIITNGPDFIQGLSYKSTAQYIINYLTYSQDPDGGWDYSINNYDNVSNNYVSGYVGLGMVFAVNGLYNFNLNISDDLISKFTNWVNYIQNDNGGSGYSNPNEDLDILKTGNMLLEMNLLKFTQTDTRVISAASYIANMWYEPACFMCQGWNSSPVANYQAAYALMSGLTSYGFSEINQTVSPFNQIDYITDVTTVLLDQQNLDGSFNANPYDFSQSDKMLSTIWALLTLQGAFTSRDNIVIELASDKSSVRQNDIVTYTVTVSNMGNVKAFNSIITDEIPSALSFIDGSVVIDGVSQPTGVSPITGISIGSVNIGKVRVISYQCQVLSTTNNTIDNIASISFNYNLPYGTTTQTKTYYSNIVSINFIGEGNLSINAKLNTTTAVVGEIVTYTINITNSGNIPLNNVTVIASLDPNLQYMNNLKINGMAKEGNIVTGVNIGRLGVRETTIINFDAKIIGVPSNGKISTKITTNYDYNTFAYKARLESNSNINEIKPRVSDSESVTVDIIIEVIVVDPKISISKNCRSTLIQVDETVIYDIDIENNGELDSVSTVLTDILPPELQVVEIKVDGNVISGDLSAGVKLGPILSGEKKSVSILVKALEAIKDYTNKSITTMKFFPIQGTDASVLIVTTPSNNTLTVNGPKLILTQFVCPSVAKLCDVVTFEIRVKNAGDITLENVIVSSLPIASLQNIPCSIYINGCKEMCENIVCGIHLGTMNPGEEYIIQFKAQIIDDSFNPIYSFSQARYYYVVSGLTKIGYSNSNLVYLFLD